MYMSIKKAKKLGVGKAKNVVDIRDKFVYLPVQKEKGS